VKIDPLRFFEKFESWVEAQSIPEKKRIDPKDLKYDEFF
tara:strand:+ start:1200 stop:1316 length:117 start_codon:yes stop_codon:yes gene_type:complete